MQILRIAGVTAGLAVAGALVGSVVGVVLMLSLILVDGFLGPDELFLAATTGGMAGALLGPIAAWLLMRHVPLWKAIGGTALGTIGAAVLGLLVVGPGAILHAGLLGFGAAAVYMRLRVPRASRRAIAPSEPA